MQRKARQQRLAIVRGTAAFVMLIIFGVCGSLRHVGARKNQPIISPRTSVAPRGRLPRPRLGPTRGEWGWPGWMPLLLSLLFSGRALAAGTWTPLVHQAPTGVELMLLLSDGTVMVAEQIGGAVYSSGWYRLTPDVHGSYVKGAWSALASMHDTRYDYASDVLQDGRVLVAGGEYGAGTARAEVYDPSNNTWTAAPVPLALLNPTLQSPEAGESEGFYDAISKILPDGNVLIAPDAAGATGGSLIYNPASNTWLKGPTFFRVGYPDQSEASWVKLPDGSILTADPSSTTSERYLPSSNRWVNDAVVPVRLFENVADEIGAALLLPDGRAF